MSTFRAFILIVLSPIIAPAVNAHEYWIEPNNYWLDANQPLLADTKVGQMFDGANLSYSASRVVWRRLANSAGLHSLPGQNGDKPAFQIPTLLPGLNILSMQTFPSSLRYGNWEKFESFANKEGLEWVLDEHRRRDLPTSDFVEIYTRFCKSLVQVGDIQQGADREIGLRFEWIAQTNPYDVNPSNPLILQLRLNGKPRAGVMASVFIKKPGQPEATTRTTLRTDLNGSVTLPVDSGGDYLISAIHMEAIDFDTQNGTFEINTEGPKTADGEGGGEKLKSRVLPQGTVWHSLWTSLTFSVRSQ